jgi:hypothetical protein
MTGQIVIRMSTLDDFISEVPEVCPLRLVLTEHRIKSHIPAKRIDLHLQAISPEDHIIWLMESHDITTHIDGSPLSPRDESIYAAMKTARDLVKQHLERHGYVIKPGSFGISKSIEPLNGHFECVQWQRKDDLFVVLPMPEEDEDEFDLSTIG